MWFSNAPPGAPPPRTVCLVPVELDIAVEEEAAAPALVTEQAVSRQGSTFVRLLSLPTKARGALCTTVELGLGAVMAWSWVPKIDTRIHMEHRPIHPNGLPPISKKTSTSGIYTKITDYIYPAHGDIKHQGYARSTDACECYEPEPLFASRDERITTVLVNTRLSVPSGSVGGTREESEKGALIVRADKVA
ncbi:hypothetical protein V5O48_006172 [Marasmius crinis-equi]|uniref:Uncharacterized protein n=1 Tax=Marasmius crinis-equi TaxID=585013 RepID=A0ABR3FK82_9AGAR